MYVLVTYIRTIEFQTLIFNSEHIQMVIYYAISCCLCIHCLTDLISVHCNSHTNHIYSNQNVDYTYKERLRKMNAGIGK